MPTMVESPDTTACPRPSLGFRVSDPEKVCCRCRVLRPPAAVPENSAASGGIWVAIAQRCKDEETFMDDKLVAQVEERTMPCHRRMLNKLEAIQLKTDARRALEEEKLAI